MCVLEALCLQYLHVLSASSTSVAAASSTFDTSGIVSMSIINPGGDYIDLRECPYQAFTRVKLHADEGTVT